jgi:hypothetical protein
MHKTVTGIMPSSLDVFIFFIKLKVCLKHTFLMAPRRRLPTLSLAANHEFF